MNTLMLTTISHRHRDVLAASAKIEDWCQTNFGKLPTIYVGFNAKAPPPLSKCPSIVIFPGQKTEGDGSEQLAYSVTVAWSIVDETVTETGNVIEYAGIAKSDEFGELIKTVLAAASTEMQIDTVDYSLNGDGSHYPQFPGRMDLTYVVDNVQGISGISF